MKVNSDNKFNSLYSYEDSFKDAVLNLNYKDMQNIVCENKSYIGSYFYY